MRWDEHSRATESQELNVPTFETSDKLVLCADEVSCAIVEDGDLAYFLILGVGPFLW